MRIINTRPDKYLIECIELDLYVILYKAMTNILTYSISTEVCDLLDKYQLSKMIKGFNVLRAKKKEITIEVFTPRRIEITCTIP